MGTVLGWEGHRDQAIEEFQRTIDLVPNHLRATANLTICLFRQNRVKDAYRMATRALEIDSGFEEMRYVLGLWQFVERQDAESLSNLERVAARYPQARLVECSILIGIGKRREAANQLEQYLRSTPRQSENRGHIEAQLAELRR